MHICVTWPQKNNLWKIQAQTHNIFKYDVLNKNSWKFIRICRSKIQFIDIVDVVAVVIIITRASFF